MVTTHILQKRKLRPETRGGPPKLQGKLVAELPGFGGERMEEERTLNLLSPSKAGPDFSWEGAHTVLPSGQGDIERLSCRMGSQDSQGSSCVCGM